MTLRIAGTREAVLSDKAYGILVELLRFRYFKRYYFEFNYDWDRLEFVQKKYAQLQPLLCRDLDRFGQFLSKLAQG